MHFSKPKNLLGDFKKDKNLQNREIVNEFMVFPKRSTQYIFVAFNFYKNKSEI